MTRMAEMFSEPFPDTVRARLSPEAARLLRYIWPKVSALRPAYQPGQVLVLCAEADDWACLMTSESALREARQRGAPATLLRHLEEHQEDDVLTILLCATWLLTAVSLTADGLVRGMTEVQLTGD